MSPRSDQLLNEYLYLKRQEYDYLFRTGESSKILAAFEEVDSLIDFLDIQIELAHGHDETYKQRLLDERNNVQDLFRNVSKMLIEMVDDRKSLDPIISNYGSQTRDYIQFKEAANAVLPMDKLHCLPELHSFFENVFTRVDRINGEALYQNAMEEIKALMGPSWSSLPSIWHQKITFCNRSLLEFQGVYRFIPEKRHLLFPTAARRFQEAVQDRSGEKKYMAYPEKFKNRVRQFLTPKTVPFRGAISPDLYQTKKLDDFLYVRDLRLNLIRKWARSIPLAMNHLLIKVYREPRYWNEKHMFMADEDRFRLGFAYFQYAMELGQNSDYATMIYRKGLDCFQKCHVVLPLRMQEKLWESRG